MAATSKTTSQKPPTGQQQADNPATPEAAQNPFAGGTPVPSTPNDPPANPNDPGATIGTEGDGPFRTAADLHPSAVAEIALAHQTYPDGRAKMIQALLDEREGYVRVGKDDRVAAVDASLQALGTSHAEATKSRQEHRDRVDRGEPDPNQPDPNLNMIIGLAEERQGYVDADKPDRVAAVDESLRRLGSTPEQAAELRKQHMERTQAPRAERSSEQQTR